MFLGWKINFYVMELIFKKYFFGIFFSGFGQKKIREKNTNLFPRNFSSCTWFLFDDRQLVDLRKDLQSKINN